MTERVLTVVIAGERVAIPSADIDTVVELANITPVPRAPRHFAGIGALHSRALFVIDTDAALNDKQARRGITGFGVVVRLGSHAYALAVDEVIDLAEIKEGPETAGIELTGAWLDLCVGRVTTDHGTMMMIAPERLITAEEQLDEVA